MMPGAKEAKVTGSSDGWMGFNVICVGYKVFATNNLCKRFINIYKYADKITFICTFQVSGCKFQVVIFSKLSLNSTLYILKQSELRIQTECETQRFWIILFYHDIQKSRV